jgi:hypothetical protein
MKAFTILTHHGILMLSLLIVPKGKSTTSSKIRIPSLSIQQIANYLSYMSLAPMDVTCINIDYI